MPGGVLTVRPATVADAKAVARIFVDSWRETYAGLLPSAYLVRMQPARHQLVWQTEIRSARPPGGVLAAELPDYGVIGFCSYGRARDAGLGYAGEVYTLYVDPNHVGRGAGRLLIRAAFARLVAQGLPHAVIWALKGNPARSFYENEGGRLVAERPGAVGGRDVTEVAFGWTSLAHITEAQ